MWSAILSLGGWVVFCLVLLLYVRWAILERDFFSGQDPENWRPDFRSETLAMKDEHPTLMERLSHLPSLGWPA